MNGSIQEQADEPKGNENDIQEEVRLLCDDLEEEKYSKNKTRFKLKVLPVETWKNNKNVSSFWSVGFLSSSLDITEDQLLDLLAPEWIEDEFEKQQKKEKPEKKKRALPQKALQVNALVVVDNALNKMIANSTQFVTEFFPLVNHVLGLAGIEIGISDILLESSERSFGLIQPLDEKHGLEKVAKPSPAFLWEAQKRKLTHDVVLVLSGLDICKFTDSVDRPFTKSYHGDSETFSCSLLGIALRPVNSRPFFRRHDCGYKVAAIEVDKPEDRVSRWLTAMVAAHEVVHLIGTTIHDGEDDVHGGGPGGKSCRGEDKHIMGPNRDITSLYRMCKEYEPWSECTLQQIEFYTANWTRFCPGSFYTYHENPLYWLLVLVPAAAFLATAAFAHHCYKKRSQKMKKLLEDEAESLKAEALLQSGGTFSDVVDCDVDAASQDSSIEDLVGSQEARNQGDSIIFSNANSNFLF